jgi:hypothetical protein
MTYVDSALNRKKQRIADSPTKPRRVAIGSSRITDPNTRSRKRFMFCDVPPVLRTNQHAAIDDSFSGI